MKKKIVLIVIVIFVLMFIVFIRGYINRKNSEILINKLKIYAEEKYNEKFEVESFIKALDHTYTNILTLRKDGNFIFNIYHNPSDKDMEELRDDYKEEIVDEKIREYIINNMGLDGVNFNVYANIHSGGQLTLDLAKKLSVQDLISEFSLYKLIIVINIDITNESTFLTDRELYDIYKEILKLNSEKLDFQVVYTSGKVDKNLNQCISNIRAYYENNWKTYPSVTGYIDILNENITDFDKFISKYVAID